MVADKQLLAPTWRFSAYLVSSPTRSCEDSDGKGLVGGDGGVASDDGRENLQPMMREVSGEWSMIQARG